MSNNHAFELVNEAVAPYGVPVKIYQSKVTGLRIALVNVGSISNGVVNGFFTLATEADCDDGCPHTLEHLIFLGSDKYPYKGLLDLLANRAFAQGTNAWTATDHTAYTITTAGAEGFLNLLPVYLDHILFPTITDSGCHTEVHHINGKGEDSGVVYAEMQARENKCSSLMYHRLQELLYEGTGYTAETGGKLADLRTLKVSSIRDYHKAYYRPDNLMCVITGDISDADVFASVQEVETKLAEKMVPQLSPMVRPFTEKKVQQLKTSCCTIKYADDDDTVGQVFIGWRGPGILDHSANLYVELLWTYLTQNPVAPFRTTFSDCEDPVCSSVDYMALAYDTVSHVVTFSGVSMDAIAEIEDRTMALIKKVRNEEGIDMKRMADVIDQRRKGDLSAMETDPHNTMSDAVIQWFLYGNGNDDLQRTVDQDEDLTSANALTQDDWLSLLDKYYIDTPYVCVQGHPSRNAGKKLREEEEERIRLQVQELGPQTLKDLETKLDLAVQANDVEAPADLIASFKIPDASKIHTIKVVSVDTHHTDTDPESVAAHVTQGMSTAALPYSTMEIEHVPSKFVDMRVFLDTQHLAPADRMWLELYLDVMFELPIERDGVLVPYEEVVKELERDTTSHSNACGVNGGGQNFVCGSFSSVVKVSIKCQIPQYKKGVQWIGEILWHSVPTTERLKVAINRLISDIPSAKRSEVSMTLALMRDLYIPNPDSNVYATNLIRQQKFLTKMLERLDKGEEQTVMQEFQAFRARLTHPTRMTVNIIGDAMHLPASPLQPWLDIATKCPHLSDEANRPNKVQLLQDLMPANTQGKALLYTPPSTESGYLCLTWPGIKTFDHPDLPALKVLMEYMTACEGVFWKALRGKGYSYGYSLHPMIEQGQMMFMITKTSKPIQAFNEAISIFKAFSGADGTAIELDEATMQAAQSGCIYGELAKGETMSSAARQVFLHKNFTGLGEAAAAKRLAGIQAVTLDDLRRVARTHLSGMLDAKQVNMVATVNPSKAELLKEGLSAHGYTLQPVEDIEGFFTQ